MSSTTVLERELLSASSARARHSHHRNEDANLILQLGTVVTAALNEIDSPPSSECTITPPSRSHVNRTLHESKRMDDRYNSTSDHLKYRSNNHIVPYQFVLQDHNYGAPPPPTPPLSPSPPSCSSGPLRTLQTHHQPPPLTAQDLCGMAALATVADQVRTGTAISSLLMQAEEDSRGSPLSSDEHDEPGPEGEETETAAEGEGDEDSVTRCICDFEHDDGYMICCDKCCVWQHVDCMGIDRSNIPEEYLCEVCQPRRVDRTRARNLQMRKQMHNDTSSSDDETAKRLPPASTQARRLSGSAARKRPAKREAKKVVKRQRRDSAAVAAREQRVSERRANKRKESMLSSAMSSPVKSESKRIGTRRRSKNKGESIDEDTQDCWGNSNGGEVERRSTQPLRQWIDSYEEAVTNHYSPELRARISSIKVNGVHSDFKVASSAVQRCRTSLQENGTKILIATSTLHANQPIIEVRGKYMLANQQSMRRGGGGGALSPSSSPYLLFYQLPKESTEVCVDARTYGNDARFVRRSCKPNAEVRHCIEKGTLHLYLVASGQLERHAEITIKHEDGGARFPCKDCPPTPCTTPASGRNGFVSQDSAERGDRRRRGSRRSTISEEGLTTPTAVVEPTSSPPVSAPPTAPTPPSTVAAATPAAAASVSPVAPAVTNLSPPAPTPAPPSPSPPAPVLNTPVTRRGPKSPTKSTPSAAQPPSTPSPSQVAQGEDSNDGTPSPHDDRESASDKRKMTREERKMEAIIKAFERLEKAEQRKQQQQQSRRGERGDRESESSGPVSRHASRDDTEPEEHEMGSSRRKGRRTRGRSSSGASNQATSADESCGAPMLSPATPVCASPRALASPPPPPVPSPEKNTPAAILSSCLGFKFPKTKKVLMNEWLNKPSEAPVSPVKLESPDDGIMVGRSGSAAVKKRWLRQAISEESELPATPTCSSPNSRAGSPPCGDYVTPLKKRRLARASVSSEQSFTPPTTPASDKEGTHSPELEEITPVASDTTSDPQAPPASQIKNSERCVEESLKVLSADKNFLNKVVPEKVVDVTSKVTPMIDTSPVKEESHSVQLKIKEEPKQEVRDQGEKKPVMEVKNEEDTDKPRSPLPPPKAPSTPPPLPQSPLSAPATPSSATTPEKVENKEGLTPASIKRKLSISEYRQRKQREEVKGEGSEGTTSPASQDEERPTSAAAAATTTAGSPMETLLEIADVKTEGAVPVGGAYMRWSSEPTLVERQRENLTERLKREFGLFVDEQDANRLAALKKQAGIIATTSAVTTATPISGNTAIQANANNMLPVLPPLEPPAFRPESPHNIPLPPCSPPPLHDLLSDPPLPPPPPQPVPPPLLPVPPPSLPITPLSLPAITTNTITVHSKSGTKTATVTVQNGPSIKNQLGKSLLLGGVQSSKHQTAPQATSGIVLNNKKPIPTSSFHNNLTRPSS